MDKITLRTRLIIGMLFIVLLLGAVVLSSMQKTSALEKESSKLMQESLRQIEVANQLQDIVVKQMTNLKSYFLYGDKEFKEQYLQSVQSFNNVYYRLLGNTSAHELNILEVIKINQDQFNALATNAIRSWETGDREQAMARLQNEAEPIGLRVTKNIEDYMAHVVSGIEMEIANLAALQQQLLRDMYISLGVALMLAVGIGIYLAISITKPIAQLVRAAEKIAQGDLSQGIEVKSVGEISYLVNAFQAMVVNLQQLIREIDRSALEMAEASKSLSQGAEQTVKGTEEVALTGQELANGAEKQARQVEEVMAIVEQISSSMEQLANSATEMAASSLQTNSFVEQGKSQVGNMIYQMENITRVVEESALRVKAMEASSNQINQFLTFISEIAEQTNLLALNAAIEAARAGENGRGFAVVAEEVRKLAEQSANATNQIAELISHIKEETNQAVNAMAAGTVEVDKGSSVAKEMGGLFNQIAQAIGSLNGQVQEITATSQQVAAGGNNILHSIEDINQIAQQVSNGAAGMAAISEEQTSSMEEVTASANQLADLADKLKHQTTSFKL